jgi:pyroglutamyl-peptidase
MLLLTGFEPFYKWDTNPSWEIAQALDGATLSGIDVVARRLPVDWEYSWPALLQAIEETRPRWVLMLGQASNRPHLSVEARGCNTCVPRPDNAGRLPASELIEADGPGHLASTLPVESIVAAIRDLGLPVQISEDAGGYLCNYALYKALAWASSTPAGPDIGFIHVPNLPGADPEIPGMSIEDMIAAVHSAIETVVNRIGSDVKRKT